MACNLITDARRRIRTQRLMLNSFSL